MGVAVDDVDRIYNTDDLAPGDNVVFCATGVTDGELLRGVRFFGGGARTHSLLMSHSRGIVRFIDTVHMWDPQQPPRVRLYRA
jgi:fructose-1,6-bisphosphatase II